ncbi:MAG: hypothetical protein M1834_002683 [Cirrosporium novae-zelandiae]|nr:MAG: hypothetical protein M1834_002683 [Cirrosporium novae-zelandiae]
MNTETHKRVETWIHQLENSCDGAPECSSSASPTPASPPRLISPPPSFSPLNNHQKRKFAISPTSDSMSLSPKRPRAATDDDSIAPSQSPSNLDLRTTSIPSFSPPTTIASPSRSSSPTRPGEKINWSYMHPIIVLVAHDETTVEIPTHVRKIHDKLFLPVDSLPNTFKADLETINLNLNGYLFHELSEQRTQDDALSSDIDWAFAKKIRGLARRNVADDVHEDSWTSLTSQVLEASLPSTLEAVPITTQKIHPGYLPRYEYPIGKSTPLVRRTDYGIAYPLNQDDMVGVEDALIYLSQQSRGRQPNIFVGGESRQLFCACVEVKKHSGDLSQAEEQLRAWVASYGKWVQSFANTKPIESIPPVLCMIVVGDVWRFYLAFWCKKDWGRGIYLKPNFDHLYLWGPLPMLTQTTESYYSTLRLMQQLRKVASYWEEDFKPALLKQLNVEELT